MWVFYICALIPIIIGLIIVYLDKNIIWWEWLIGSALAFIVAAIMHGIAIWGMTDDIETWSGRVTKVSHYPSWTEQWEETHSETTTDSKGHSHTRTWTTTEYDHHPERWFAYRDFGTESDDVRIEESLFDEISYKFGGNLHEDGTQSTDHGGFKISGDDTIYSVDDVSGYIYPATITKNFENRIKAAPTVFSFSQVPTNVNVYSWPENDDWAHSDRLLGTASVLINHYKWDCMNSILGPTKKVNVIMVGFGDVSEDYAEYQQAKWIGGKKNDLVICFGGASKTSNAKWVKVFGWTERELVKKDLETIVLENPIDNNLIPLISDEISKNYVIKDWKKFDYIVIHPPTWSYWVYFIVMAVTQTILYFCFDHYHDDIVGGSGDYSYGRYGRNSRYY